MSLQTSLPLASKEGFVRQLIGWREFVYHIHEHTGWVSPKCALKRTTLKEPGDGGYQRWLESDWRPKDLHPRAEGGANPSVLELKAPLPLLSGVPNPAFFAWTTSLKRCGETATGTTSPD